MSDGSATQTAPAPTEYWEARYRAGGASGAGSIGAVRAWKWSAIEGHIGALNHVLDVGCGDLSFWEGRNCPRYLGIDLSETILRKNRLKRPGWSFVCADAARTLRVHAEVVFCMDVLFHILEESRFRAIVANLCAYTDQWLFVCTWGRNPFARGWSRVQCAFPQRSWAGRAVFLTVHPLQVARAIVRGPVSGGSHERYHSFEATLDMLRDGGLSLVSTHPSPFDGGINSLYVFRRNPT